MATADRLRWTDALPILGIAAASIAFAAWRTDDTDGSGSSPTATALSIEAASVYQFAALDEMLVASDAVVVGVVEATSRGRLVGDPGGGGVISRIVTVRIEQVLWAPSTIPSEVVLVEEEGWLPDGTPIEVNGVPASATGDRGLWFLDRVGADDLASMVVINSQGRFLAAANGDTVGGDQRDPLVRTLQAYPFDQLVAISTAVAQEQS